MKRFIKKSVFLSFPIVFLLILMECLLRNIPNDYSYKKQYLDRNASQIETLILGSSHSSYGFDPTFFSSKAFNASHISQSLDYDIAIYMKYQSQFKNLKTIVLPISYFSLFYVLKDGPEPWREKNYAIYYDINGSATIAGHSEVASHKANLTMMRLFFYYFRDISFMSCSKSGYGLREYFPTENLEMSGKTAAKRHSISAEDDIYKIMEGYKLKKVLLQDFINQCKVRNINIIFLTPPAYKSYYENLDEQQINATVETGIHLDQANKNVIYLNLLKDNRFTAKDFHNADHLSQQGTEKLSKIINTKIEEWK